MTKYFFLAGAILAGLAVAFGAFGAHMLESKVSTSRLATFETGVQYQMYHALALLIVGYISLSHPGLLNSAGYCFLGGIIIFSGSLYLLVLTDTAWLGAITPIGGVLFIVGWILLAVKSFHLLPASP